ncbi:unnamed protein product [Arabis nemorensis]|uniref:F-box associated beta-propeller type 3 domain-containing protein n=1 Tax=Arabis nemorensis TaxID=586526 RepID=A0A565CSI5_9BRAS|nr:unnamed protein product [Arabis nemorensis]
MKPGSFKLSDVNRIDPSERSHGEEMHIISSFNGLICCINRIYDKDVESELCDLQIWICNPFTGETLLLPQGRRSYQFVPSVGVAYYSNTSDYLVFRIFCVGKKSPEERVFDGYDYPDGHMVRKYQYALAYECEVYSSNTGSWRNIGPVPCLPMNSYYSPFRSAHVFVGGKVYWLSSLVGRGKILSVDLRGKFKVIKLPHYSDGLKEEDSITEGSYLINLRGALSMVVLHPGYMDTWVWKEGDKKSSTWVCEYVDKNPNDDDLELVLAMTSSGKQIMCMTNERWCYFDVETGTWTKKRVNSAEFESPVVFPFTESVLPCNGGLMV